MSQSMLFPIPMLLVAMGTCAGIYAQSGFNVHLDSVQLERRGIGLSIREVEGGAFLLTRQYSALGNAPVRLFSRLLDAEGTVVADYEHGPTDDRDHWISEQDPVSLLSDGSFAVPVTVGSSYADSSWLYRFSPTGVLLEREPLLGFPGVDSIRHQFSRVRSLNDGSLILCGSSSIGTGPQRGLMLHYTNGAIDWVRSYPQVDHFTDVSALPDGGFAIAGYRSNSEHKACLMRTSANGDVVWTRFSGGVANDAPAIRTTSDGETLMFTTYAEPGWPNSETRYVLTKWGLDGVVIWETYTEPGAYMFASDMELYPDDGVLLSGTHGGLGSVARFSPSGEELWSRTYSILSSMHYINDVTVTSDGGLLLAGSAWSYPPVDTHVGTRELIWAIKTDSLGCVVPGCSTVGVQEYAVDLNEYLRIAPNPVAQGQAVQVSFDPPAGFTAKGPLRVVVLDALGRTLQQGTMPSGVSAFTFPRSALPAGLYYLHLIDDTRWLAGGKVVVE